jgi:hypothetical protein
VEGCVRGNERQGKSGMQRVLAYYRQGGSAEVLRRLSASGCMPASLFFFSTIQVYALGPSNERALKRTPQGYEFAQVDAGVLDELVGCHGGQAGTPRRVFVRFFEQGQDCFVVRRHGVLVAYFWVFKDSYQLVFDLHERRRLTLGLKSDQRFFGNGYIAPTHRLKGLFPHLIQFVVGHYPSQTRFFSSVNSLNHGSLLAHSRFGFAPVLRVTCAQAGVMRMFYAQRPSGLGSVLGIGRAPTELDGCLRRRLHGAVPDVANGV